MIVRELFTRLSYIVDDSGAMRYERRINSLARAAEVAVAVIAGLGVVTAMAGDRMTTAIARINSVMGGTAESATVAADVYERLYDVSQRTGVSANESAATFARFHLAMSELNRPASDTIDLIEGIQASAITAGNTTQELTRTMIQLGQALGSGKLQGDEFRSLRENMPAFAREIARELNMTMDQFMEAAEKGNLRPATLIPAMLRASRNARTELARFPMTMDRSFRILRVTATRFLADLDKVLGISRGIARLFQLIAQRIEAWRQGLPVLERWVQQLGGMYEILRSAGYALAIFTSIVVAYRSAVIAATLAQYAWLLPWILIAAACVALGVLLADFVSWVSGQDIDTLFGQWFGNAEQYIAPFREAWTGLVTWITGTLDAIGAEFQRFWDHGQIQETMRLFAGVASLIMQAWEPLSTFFSLLWEAITTTFTTTWETLRPIVEAIQRVMAWMADPMGRRAAAAAAGTGGEAAPATTPAPGAPIPPGQVPRGFGRRAPQYGPNAGLTPEEEALLMMYRGATPGSMPGPPTTPPVNATQNNQITIEQNIQANGGTPAEIAAAARTGVSQAGTQIGQTQDQFGRSIAAANPRTEPATQ